ncbi:Acetyltransferase (GNAT) domain-containing protein [Hymenobacter daecheongensis DSM 21074]|uniref:Acetyltransferase (GNAT) domain-containing protein n=1 Tax=Hymenobacter daecheongensis DSM 21074 TaxID=1121955 RepID=A0A1M5ZZQ0_9BACT|nr:GNAT family N-acetyltransferase [Hymenobacter daecheongensis]SHI29393.1 Acetyltransferase (GNAT) domain-containing protein [Hymenobacter daecheongensis DSM 21074]
MPLRYLPFSALNLAAWDACVAGAAQAVPYAQADWLRATAGRWDAVVEVEEATGRYLAVLPLPVKRRPWGREVYQPAFTQQLGLLTTPGSRHQNLADYLALLPGRYARLYTQLNAQNELGVAPAGFSLAQRQTYLMPLAFDYPALLAGYHADYRRRLRLNQQQPRPLVVTETASVAAIIQLFQEHKGGEVAGLKPRHYQQLARLTAALQTLGQALILEVRHPETGELLAGALFVVTPRRLIYLFAAASPAGKKAGAPLLLPDYVIRCHAATPGLVLDFEGGMIPSIARFFANFGAAPVPYAALTQTSLPWYLSWKR